MAFRIWHPRTLKTTCSTNTALGKREWRIIKKVDGPFSEEGMSKMRTHARYYLTTIHDPRLARIFDLRRNATVLGVRRDICLLAVAAWFYLNYHFIQVQIEIYSLPTLIVFVP